MARLIQWIVLVIFLFIIHSSCSKQDYTPHTELYISEPFYIKGQIKAKDQSGFNAFYLETGASTDIADDVFWNNVIEPTSIGTALTTGLYSPDIFIRKHIFAGFQFWSLDLPNNRKWTKSEIEHFFEIGRIFEMGQGETKVDFQYRWSNEVYLDLGNSKTSYLVQPEGVLVITAIEDVDYQSKGINNTPLHRFGKRISCEFNCIIGRFQPHGNLPFFTTETIEIRDAEAVFFVDY